MTSECPICGKDQEEGFCPHFVATLCDDSDGFDVRVPMFFGWDTVTDDHDDMIDAVLEYFTRLKDLIIAVADVDRSVRDLIEAKYADFPSKETDTIQSLFKGMDSLSDDPDIETEDIIWELQTECKAAFDKFYVDANGKPDAESYGIDTGPGASWTGTNYWSSNGRDCAKKITKAMTEAKGRLDALIALIPSG